MTKKKAILIVSSLLGLIVAYGFWQFKAIGKIDQTPSADINDASFWDRQFEREASEKHQNNNLKDELEGNSKKERSRIRNHPRKPLGKKRMTRRVRIAKQLNQKFQSFTPRTIL